MNIQVARNFCAGTCSAKNEPVQYTRYHQRRSEKHGSGEPQMTLDVYHQFGEKKAKLRLYLNDPLIKNKINCIHKPEFPVPIEIEGKMIVSRDDKGDVHIFFTHNNPNFAPVFIDYLNGKTLPKRREKGGDKQ
jgi:hypothetical protein